MTVSARRWRPGYGCRRRYFTPRPLIRALVEVMRPEPGMRIADPACGTGGFLLAAYEWIARNHLLDPDEKRQLRYETLQGWEIDTTSSSMWGKTAADVG